MREAVAVLGRRFAWRNHAIPSLNAMPELRVETDQETREVIVAHNKLDLALYEWVKASGCRIS